MTKSVSYMVQAIRDAPNPKHVTHIWDCCHAIADFDLICQMFFFLYIGCS